MAQNAGVLIDVNKEIENYISAIKQPVPWDFSNKILYDLCKKNPEHLDEKIIVAKTIIIGRVYAATLERNGIKKSKEAKEAEDDDSTKTIGDDFYFKHVVPLFHSFFGKPKIIELEKDIRSQGSRMKALKLQSLFANELKKLKRGGKTSFSSKYLHFHFPDHFFIYDQRAREALPYLKSFIENKTKKKINYNQHPIKLNLQNIDIDYFLFENRCHAIKSELGVLSTNREVDNLLIYIANGIRRLKRKK